jgi:hypothetical protein
LKKRHHPWQGPADQARRDRTRAELAHGVPIPGGTGYLLG